MNTTSFLKRVSLLVFISLSARAQGTDISFESMMNEPTATEGENLPYHPAPPPLYKGTIHDEHALYGFSIGALMITQSYIQINTTYDPSNLKKPADKSARDLETYQSAGAILRYSILPVDHIGTDINISYMSSINHEDVKKSLMTITKGELNLGYTWSLNKNFKIYLLIGGGVQYITGHDVELIMQRTGYGGQGGLGLSISQINIEMLASYYRNRISDDVNQTATETSRLDNDHTYVDASGVTGRISYNF